MNKNVALLFTRQADLKLKPLSTEEGQFYAALAGTCAAYMPVAVWIQALNAAQKAVEKERENREA